MLNKLRTKIKGHPHQSKIILGLLLVTFIFILVLMRIWDGIRLRQETNEHLVPWVRLVKAEHTPASEKIVLPGTILAWHEAPIYARTNGYQTMVRRYRFKSA